MKSWACGFHMKAKILADFQICISVLLIFDVISKVLLKRMIRNPNNKLLKWKKNPFWENWQHQRFFLSQNDVNVVETFLFGLNDFNDKENVLISEETFECRITTERFKAPMLWIHLSKATLLLILDPLKVYVSVV